MSFQSRLINDDNVLVKSPFNYIGGKYKYLNQLFKYFPQDINCMVDVFGGGFNVGVNTKCKSVWYNDQLTPLVELLEYLTRHTTKHILSYIEDTIKLYDLNKTDKSSFNVFREKYNNDKVKCPLDLLFYSYCF